MIEGLPEHLVTSVSTAFQHIELIRAKEARLVQAREDTLHQILHHIGTEYRTGNLTQTQLCAALALVRSMKEPGAMNAWDEIVGVSWKHLSHVAKQLPDGPNGTWVGEYPFTANTQAPPSGTSVVYVLFDSTNEPCYVGSTRAFRARLRQHRKDGKGFVRWQAYPCDNREHAYQLEDRLLKQHKPYLNAKAGR